MIKLKLDLKPLLKKLEIVSRKNIRGDFAGEYRSVYKGTGLEFEGYRDYTQADDAMKIDWRASMRAKKLLVRELVEERNLSVMFMFDVSNSMLFASVDKLKCEYAAEVIASLAFPMIQAGDSVSLMMFSDKIVKHVPLSSGRKQYFNIINTLSDPKLYGGNFDLTYALKRASAYLKKDGTLIIVSDFIGLKDDWEDHLKVAGKKFDVMAVIIKDPLDLAFPANIGQIVLQDPFSNEKILIDPLTTGKAYEEKTLRRLEEIKDNLTKSGADHLILNTSKPYISSIVKVFEKRKALWR